MMSMCPFSILGRTVGSQNLGWGVRSLFRIVCVTIWLKMRICGHSASYAVSTDSLEPVEVTYVEQD